MADWLIGCSCGNALILATLFISFYPFILIPAFFHFIQRPSLTQFLYPVNRLYSTPTRRLHQAKGEGVEPILPRSHLIPMIPSIHAQLGTICLIKMMTGTLEMRNISNSDSDSDTDTDPNSIMESSPTPGLQELRRLESCSLF